MKHKAARWFASNWPKLRLSDTGNPYKTESNDEWQRICEKYGEEDKSKLTKENRGK